MQRNSIDRTAEQNNGVSNVNNDNESVLNVIVIGAGASGLCSAKHCIAQGYNVTIYEQSEELGGVWVYTDEVGKDKYGVNIHTAMYKGLRTNTPYQLIEFPDHHHPNDTVPFPPQSDILKFLHSYADRFDLKKNIKCSHLVIRVQPIENDKWEIIVKDLPNDKFNTQICDAVFVCNGHYFAPRIPNIDGACKFEGKLIHSHDFRTAEAFRDESVLVIGAGHGGVDLTVQLSGVAERVTLSQNKPLNGSKHGMERRQMLPANTTLGGYVEEITAEGAKFIDGTQETFSAIIYATGYNYSYPFLSVDCGIHVDDNHVQPLYKHIFNIKHPTMAFIGLPWSLNSFHLFDLQSRFALKFLSGQKKLPSINEMLRDQHDETEAHWNKGYPKHKTHFLVLEQRDYQKQLAEIAEIENLPDVFYAIDLDACAGLRDQPTDFRNFKYDVIDEKTYIKEKYDR